MVTASKFGVHTTHAIRSIHQNFNYADVQRSHHAPSASRCHRTVYALEKLNVCECVRVSFERNIFIFRTTGIQFSELIKIYEIRCTYSEVVQQNAFNGIQRNRYKWAKHELRLPIDANSYRADAAYILWHFPIMFSEIPIFSRRNAHAIFELIEKRFELNIHMHPILAN